jgi:hypothetical protein
LTESGRPLRRAGLDNAWQDLITAAIEAEVITGERPQSDAMLDLYDHEVAIIDPASRQHRGNFYRGGFFVVARGS